MCYNSEPNLNICYTDLDLSNGIARLYEQQRNLTQKISAQLIEIQVLIKKH